MSAGGTGPLSTCPQCGWPDQVEGVAPIVASHRGHLSWWLAAPPPPGTARPRRAGQSRLWWLLRLALLALLPLDLLLLAVLLALAAVVGVVVAAASLLVLAGYLAYRVVDRGAIAQRRERRQAERAAVRRRYQHALACWHQLAYCHRCQGVYLPGWGGPHARGAVAPAWHAWSLAQQFADAADRARCGHPLPEGIEHRR